MSTLLFPQSTDLQETQGENLKTKFFYMCSLILGSNITAQEGNIVPVETDLEIETGDSDNGNDYIPSEDLH